MSMDGDMAYERMVREHEAGDVQRSAGDERRIVELEVAVHRAKRALYWTVFQACFMAMVAWTGLTGLVRIAMAMVAEWAGGG